MKNVWSPSLLAGVLCALLASSVSAQAQQAQPVRYTVTDLGPASLSNAGQPSVIENNDLIADAASASGLWQATLWYLGMPFNLAKSGPGGPNSVAFAVNQRAQAVGEAETTQLDPGLEDFCGFGDQRVCQPFLWQNGVMTLLPLLKDANGVAGRNAAAHGINLQGQVAGSAENTTVDSTCPPYDPTASALQYQKYQFKPVLWIGGQIQALPLVGSDPDGIAFKINSSGQAVGGTGICTGFQPFGYLYAQHATLWQNGTVTDLGNLGGIAPQFGNFAYDVNNWGHAVGTSGTAGGSFHAFFWSPETQMQDLGTLPGDFASVSLSINDVGDVTGGSFPANGLPRAFLRPDGGTMIDLNSLIPANSPLHLFTACSINSRGEIVGLAVDAQGNGHGYLAVPSNSAAEPLDESAAAIQSARFDYAWQVLRDRLGVFRAAQR